MRVENVYDTAELLKQAAQWRHKATLADQPASRDACLREAVRYEALVRRSLEVPLFQEGTPRGETAVSSRGWISHGR